MLNEPNDALLASLKSVVGDAGWMEPTDRYLTEMRGLYRGRAAIVLRPASTGRSPPASGCARRRESLSSPGAAAPGWSAGR